MGKGSAKYAERENLASSELEGMPLEADKYLVGVHVHEAETFGAWGFALDQTDVLLIQIGKGIQALQDGLHRGGGLHVLDDHSLRETQGDTWTC